MNSTSKFYFRKTLTSLIWNKVRKFLKLMNDIRKRKSALLSASINDSKRLSELIDVMNCNRNNHTK